MAVPFHISWINLMSSDSNWPMASDYLLAAPTGGRLWRTNYRFLGQQKTLSLGTYPKVSLAKARERRTAAREALADGQDPIEVRKAKVREAKSKSEETFKTIADEWLARLEIDHVAPTGRCHAATGMVLRAQSQSKLSARAGSPPR